MKKWMLIPFFLILADAIAASARYRSEAIRSRTELADARREIERLRAAPPPPDPEPAALPASAAMPPASLAETDALLAQVRELEQLLQEPEPAPTGGSPQAGAAAAPQSPRNWMEELKKTDPARYEEILRRREQVRQEIVASHTEQTDFFLKRAEESGTVEEQARYEQITRILDHTWQMMEALRAELPVEQRRELQGAIRENLRTLSPLLAAEREREWRRLGHELGATEAESQVISARINQVLRVTNARHLLRQRSGGGPGSRSEPRRDR